jgi:hypothetical protein
MTTFFDAEDEIFDLVVTGTTNADSILGDTPEFLWPGDNFSDSLNANDYYIKVFKSIATSDQYSFKDINRKYRTNGTVTIEFFAPRSVGDGLRKIKTLALELQHVMRAHRGSVYLREITTREGAASETHNRQIVICNFEYSEIV